MSGPARPKAFWPAFAGLTCLGLGLLLYDLGTGAQAAGRLSGSLKWQLGGLGGLALFLAAAAWFGLTLTRAWPPLAARLEPAAAKLRRLGALNLLPPLLGGALFLLLVYFPPRAVFEDPAMFAGLAARLGLILLVGLFSAPFLSAAFPALSAPVAAALACAAAGVLYRVVGYFPEISASPFTLAWSEASRFYYGSLFQAEALYGQPFPWPFLHPSRYLLLSLPFLIPGLPIWAHRLWQVLLWLGLSALTAGLLARRLKRLDRPSAWIAAGWAFLFLFQGPVYYHLLVCVAPVLAWFERRRLGRSLLVVAAASAWAGISRINWWPMPACLAIMLYLLETPLAEPPRVSRLAALGRYLLRPALWAAAGLAAAAGANALYIRLSGQPDSSSFGSSFTSDLLWNRLWPSPTYPPGILPMALLLSLPLWLLIGLKLRRGGLHPLRGLALAAMTLLMFAGGLVVSTKIGGGSNLHNLDAYFVLLLVWGAHLYSGDWARDNFAAPAARPAFGAPWILTLLVLSMPFVPLLQGGRAINPRNLSDLRAEADQLRALVQSAAADGGEVLFIWQRQLLTFDEVEGVALIYEYETVDLMEMAMSNNRPYLEEFYRQLADHRFALIVAGAQNDVIKEAKDPFSEENNVWVERVTRPILAYYQPLLTYPLTGTQLLEPKP